MSGDDLIRFCAQCNHHVYNFSKMTVGQIESLLRAKEGRMCVRFERMPDGSIITRQEPKQLSFLQPRLLSAAGATLVTALSLNATTPAQTPVNTESRALIQSGSAAVKAPDRAPSQDTGAKLLVTAFDPYEALIARAKVSIINESTERAQTGFTSEEGQYQSTLLEAGSYTIKIEFGGFHTFTKTGLILRAGSHTHFGATVQVAATMGEAIVTDAKIEPTSVPGILLEKFKALKLTRDGSK
jgi:hypothetical protein